jgi:hypothetical protein
MEGSLAEAQAEIVKLNSKLTTKSKASNKRRRILMQSLKMKLQKVRTCKSHWGNFKINVWTSATIVCSDWRNSLTQLEPVLKSLNLQLKTCQASLIILKARLCSWWSHSWAWWFLRSASFSWHNCRFYEGWLHTREYCKPAKLQLITSGLKWHPRPGPKHWEHIRNSNLGKGWTKLGWWWSLKSP